jgi:hypothetical protein
MSGMPWFRLFSEARTDAKLRTLADDEHRVWFALLCYAAEQSERGSIPPGDAFLLAIEVAGGDEELLGRTLTKLVRLRILTEVDGGGYVFSNFLKRQYDKPSDRPERVSERVKRHRAGARNDKKHQETPGNDRNADVTPCNAIDTDKSREDTETEKTIEATPHSADAPSPRSDGDVYALVDAFAEGKGLKKSDVTGALRQKSFRALQTAPPWASPADVFACTKYLMSDPFWEKPGKLQAEKVVETLPDWRKEKPAAWKPTSNGRASPSGQQPFSARSELARLEAVS